MFKSKLNEDDFPDSELRYTPITENVKALPSDSWMIRSCEWYKQELSECTRWLSRFHQYYCDGRFLNCDQWETDHKNCLHFRKTKNIETLKKVLESEKNRINQRLVTSGKNDVWKYRDTPPSDWNKPLPQWFQDKNKKSYLKLVQEEAEKKNVI